MRSLSIQAAARASDEVRNDPSEQHVVEIAVRAHEQHLFALAQREHAGIRTESGRIEGREVLPHGRRGTEHERDPLAR